MLEWVKAYEEQEGTPGETQTELDRYNTEKQEQTERNAQIKGKFKPKWKAFAEAEDLDLDRKDRDMEVAGDFMETLRRKNETLERQGNENAL